MNMLSVLVTLLSTYHCQSLRTFRTPYETVEDDCKTGLCTGAGSYPSSPDILYYAEFNIPPLPTSFDMSMTYYIYFNIFFGCPQGGKFNQFVPQLMLGSALSGSTGPPYYKPIFTQMKTWHFGSQYFFALLNDSVSSGWSPYAKTGDLIETKEGDILYTEFKLSSDSKTWTLTMGKKGDDQSVSIVTTDTPFMGLLNTTKSWDEDVYNHTYVGSCWELYGIKEKQNYPNYMDYVHNISSVNSANFWHSWHMDETPTCSFSPNYTLNSSVNGQNNDQIALWDMFYPNTLYDF
eukprot:108146_1